MDTGFDSLKAYQREHREGFSEGLSLRVHRSLSWLKRASLCDDLDGEFLFLWIAFNAAYGTDFPEPYKMTERNLFRTFLEKLVKLDEEHHKLSNLVWQEFSGPIRVLLENQYVFQPFWDSHNGKQDAEKWKQQFADEKQAINNAMGQGRTQKVLSLIFSRLYTLRNQMVHGGATWNSQLNRQQLKDGVAIMRCVIPVILELMMTHPDHLWGDVSYPVVES